MSYRMLVQGSGSGERRLTRGARSIRRGALGLLALSLLAATMAPWAQAATDAATSFQTVTGANGGYQLQIPADWQKQAVSFQAQVGSGDVSGTMRIDSLETSPDQSAIAGVDTLTGLPLTNAQLENAAQGAIYGGAGAAAARSGSSITLLGDPQTVAVPNAEAAVEAAASYSDANGVARIMTVRVALQGRTAYLLVLDVSQDFYQNDPAFAAMLNSFQLTPAAISASAS